MPLFVFIDLTFLLLSISISITSSEKWNSTPFSIKLSVILSITFLISSVPIWAWFSYFIDLLAPNSIRISRIYSIYLSLILVVNLASENVPAPPSPNWTLLFSSNIPSLKNLSTSICLSFILLPFSNTLTLKPAWDNLKAEKIPLGPYPTIITILSVFIWLGFKSSFLYIVY